MMTPSPFKSHNTTDDLLRNDLLHDLCGLSVREGRGSRTRHSAETQKQDQE